MNKITFLLLLVPCAAYSGMTGNDWTKEDSVREAAYLTLHFVDWGQTRNIVNRYKQGENKWEKNPLLGEHPSIKRVDSYMTFMAVAHVSTSYVLPRPWREAFQYTTIVYNAGVVIKNNSIGLRIDFK